MAGNTNLRIARKDKQDEFYTQLEDIENELRHYRKHFNGKVVLCNCDDPYESNFFKYFAMNFNQLGLKKLIATCYAGSLIADTQMSIFDEEQPEEKKTRVPHKIVITEVTDVNGDGAINLGDVEYLIQNDKNVLTRLKGSGDFRSDECIDLLKEADIVVTNPPFSLFREYMAQIIEYQKSFLIIGNQNNVTYKEIFKLIMQNKIWAGVNAGAQKFEVPLSFERNNTYMDNGKKYAKFGNICWFTNLDHNKRHEELDMYKHYSTAEYQYYDNYNAIDVGKTADIPMDFDGIMGVPITFVYKYNPEQFEIVGITDRGNEYGLKTKEYTKVDSPKYGDLNRRGALLINNELKSTFAKLLIRRKQ
ncbi:MAG: adenine-specific methyltransferase EcoRI family protein [Bacteroidales bacterium]|nr:adenine-specific methyltransferase EcoRI family protein [Bacteroidales bacterium]